VALAAYWFGLYFLFQPVGTSLVPSQVDDLVPPDRQTLGIGLLLGFGAFLAMIVAPFVGAWSDRLSTPWGRRRPIIVAGTVGTLASLGLMMLANNYPLLFAGYALVQLFTNAAGAAFSGIIPDVVRTEDYGAASGWLSVMQLVGSAGGLAANVAFAAVGTTRLTYAAIGVVLTLSMLPTLRAARGEGLIPAPPRPRVSLREQARAFLAPMHSGDFSWVIWTRMANNFGISVVTPFTLNFFRDVVGLGKHGADLFNPIWYLVVLVFAAPLGRGGGRVSDRRGRKPFIYVSGGVQAAVALLFIAVYPKAIGFVLVLGALYGIGYGMYVAVDWALACDTLPDRADIAKDMGLFHIALTLPGNVAPALGGLALGAVNGSSGIQGYRVVFGSAAVCFVLSTVLVRRIRSVR